MERLSQELATGQRLRSDLEDDALIVGAAHYGCAEDVSFGVDGYASVGQSSLVAADEIVEVGESPPVGAGTQFENRAETVGACRVSEAVDVSFAVESKFVVGTAVTTDQAVDGVKVQPEEEGES
jgi:hypothetical protein